jgi:hypothetical protein
VPRCFFDLHNNIEALHDEGKGLPDLEAAKVRALREARHLVAASAAEQGKIELRHNQCLRRARGMGIKQQFQNFAN